MKDHCRPINILAMRSKHQNLSMIDLLEDVFDMKSHEPKIEAIPSPSGRRPG